MIQANPEIETLAKSALSALREYGRGGVVPHHRLSRAVGMTPDNPLYYRVVRKARRMLRDEDGIWSRPENGKGFHLYTKLETFTEEQTRRAKRARRQLGIAVRAAVAVPDSGLSLNEKRLRESAIRSATESRRQIEVKAKVAEQMASPFKGSPRRLPIAKQATA